MTQVLPITPVQEAQEIPAIAAGGLKEQGKNIAELVLFDEGLFNRVQKWGQMMAGSKSMVPGHLQGKPADCSAVIMQALRWGVDPYACAQKTHLVNGTLGYEAQLVNAILLSKAPIEGRPKYTKIGDWTKVIGKANGTEEGVGVRLEIKLKGEELQPFDLLLSQASVRNSPLWKSDPFQQLCYLAIKRWARLYCPDVIMGVYTPDELDNNEHVGADKAQDITPPASKAGAFAASVAPPVKAEEPVAEEPTPQPLETPTKAEEASEVVYIKTPPGSPPTSGELACNSVKKAADKILKAIALRYQKGNQEEIEWIIKNNAELLVRIQHEEPEQYKVINDLSVVPTATPEEGGLL